LLTTLINKINQRFNYLESGYESYFEKWENLIEDLDVLLSTRRTRYIAKGNILQVDNQIYQPYDLVTHKMVNFKPRTEILFMNTLDGRKLVSIHNNIYQAVIYDKKINEIKWLSFPATAKQRYFTLRDFMQYKSENKVVVNQLYERKIKNNNYNSV
jgi:hypothetical protein